MISDEHLRRQAQKVIAASGGVPDDLPPSAVQAVIETSDVETESITQEQYDLLFEHTEERLREALNEPA